MIWTINHRESTSIIRDLAIYALDPEWILVLYQKTVDSILNKVQMEAVVQFLQRCVDDPDHFDAIAADANLNKMRKYL